VGQVHRDRPSIASVLQGYVRSTPSVNRSDFVACSMVAPGLVLATLFMPYTLFSIWFYSFYSSGRVHVRGTGLFCQVHLVTWITRSLPCVHLKSSGLEAASFFFHIPLIVRTVNQLSCFWTFFFCLRSLAVVIHGTGLYLAHIRCTLSRRELRRCYSIIIVELKLDSDTILTLPRTGSKTNAHSHSYWFYALDSFATLSRWRIFQGQHSILVSGNHRYTYKIANQYCRSQDLKI